MIKIRVVLVEDHFLTRMGLHAALDEYEEIDIVGEAEDGVTGLTIVRETEPDVAIIDIGLPKMDGIELDQQLRAKQNIDQTAKTKVMMLTMHSETAEVLAAFAAGAGPGGS